MERTERTLDYLLPRSDAGRSRRWRSVRTAGTGLQNRYERVRLQFLRYASRDDLSIEETLRGYLQSDCEAAGT